MTENNKPVVFVCLPVYGGSTMSETAACVERLIIAFEKAGMGYYTYRASMADVVDTRNCMLSVWYDKHPESEWMLMIDNDMIFSAEMVLKMLTINKPVVGCIYSKKHFALPDKDGKLDFWDLAVGEPLPESERSSVINGFQQWKYVGGGVLLIKREVVTKILEQMPGINDTTDPGFLTKTGVSRVIGAFDKIVTEEGRHLSEDCSFCERWRKCGGEVWAAVGFMVGHRGLHTFEFHAQSMLGLDGQGGRFPNEGPLPVRYIPAEEYDQQHPKEITWLAEQIKGANSILEIGSAAGQSLRYLSAGLAPGARIRAIDLGVFPEEARQLAGAECKTALLDTANELRCRGFDVEVMFGDSHARTAESWAWDNMPDGGYDLVFIDGDHTEAGVRQDYEMYGPMGKQVAFHDIVNENCEVRHLWRELKASRPSVSFVAEDSGMGIGIVRNHKKEAVAA